LYLMTAVKKNHAAVLSGSGSIRSSGNTPGDRTNNTGYGGTLCYSRWWKITIIIKWWTC